MVPINDTAIARYTCVIFIVENYKKKKNRKVTRMFSQILILLIVIETGARLLKLYISFLHDIL